jgi:hypothetical protein
MRVVKVVMTAAIVAGLSGAARAQTPAPATPVPPPPAGSTAPHYIGTTASHWEAAGFVGSSFSSSNDNNLFTDMRGNSVDFGGQITYLWRGIIGPEFLANFSPSFKMDNPLLADDPEVNSYMLNAIGALPLGARGQFTPYVSGGYGALTARADVLGVTSLSLTEDTPLDLTTTSSTRTKFGSNIGGGLMAFAGNIGVRADVRYFRTPTLNEFSSTTAADQFTETLVSGLRYWKANIGLAFTW